MASKNKVFTNMMWRFFERSGAEVVTFIVSIVLARILSPEDYGSVALVVSLTTVMQVFVNFGMGPALIQKKDISDADYSTAFYFSLVISILFYSILFAGAPAISCFFNYPGLSAVLRVQGIIILINGVNNIQQSFVAKNMIFKKFFYATLGGTVFSGIVGIILALAGYGIWALVAQKLINPLTDTLILWFTIKWRPKRVFSKKSFSSLFNFGWKIFLSSTISTLYAELRPLVLGKVYTNADLAYYKKGDQFPRLIVSNIDSSIDSVLLPTLSAEQDNKERVRIMTSRAIKTSTYLIFPLMVGLAVCAEPIVRLVLTDKWLPAVFFLRIFCFSYAFYPVASANLNAIKAMGRSDLYLKLEIIKTIVGIVALVPTMFISVEAMALSLLITTILGFIINSWPNKKLLNYFFTHQIRDMTPQIIISLVMGVIVYSVSFIGLMDIFTLMIQIPIGVVIYIIASKLFKVDSFDYILGIIKVYLLRK